MRKIGFRAVSQTTCAGFFLAPLLLPPQRELAAKNQQRTTKNNHRSRSRVVKMGFLAQHHISHRPKVTPDRPDFISLGSGITHFVHLPSASITISFRHDLAAIPSPPAPSIDFIHCEEHCMLCILCKKV